MEIQSIILLISMLGIGLLAGCIGSILGIGGGLITTPFLTLVFGLDIKTAIASSIVVVIATSSGAAISYLKDNVINLKAAMFFEIFTTIGGLIGALVTGIIAPSILYIVFSCVLICSIVNMILRIKNGEKLTDSTTSKTSTSKLRLYGKYYDEQQKQTISYNLEHVPAGSAIMLFAGIMSGMLGIGSGVFKVIAMDGVMKMPLKVSSATSNLMMGVTAAASALIYFFNGSIQPQITVPVVIGVVAGATIGSKIMPMLPKTLIRILFIIVAIVLCAQMIGKAFGVI